MKIIVTHNSPDWDAITSVWLLKRFLPGWEKAVVEFVPAGEKSEKRNPSASLRARGLENRIEEAIEKVGDEEIVHVDTGLGPLDHHQTLIRICRYFLPPEQYRRNLLLHTLQT